MSNSEFITLVVLTTILTVILAINQHRYPKVLGWDFWNWPKPDQQRLNKVAKKVIPVLALTWLSIIVGDFLPYSRIVGVILVLIAIALAIRKNET